MKPYERIKKFKLISRLGITIIGVLLLIGLCAATKEALPEVTSRPDVRLTYLIICLGACVGALMAALVSPFHSKETDSFKLVAGVASAFVAGLLSDKLGPVIQDALQATQESTLGATRLVAFGIAMFLSGFVNYAFRVYGRETSNKDIEESLTAIKGAVAKLETITRPANNPSAQ